MRIVFVNPPNSYQDRTYLAPPLGLLTLASFLQQFGYEVDVLDLNLEMLDNCLIDDNFFYKNAVNRILDKQPDIVGFTSMCLESHVSLEIAKRIKEQSSKIHTVFGGTHFGAIAREVLLNYSFADYAVTGEGEHASLSILNYLSGISDGLPQNVFYSKDNLIFTGEVSPQILKMEEIPFPAYELVDLKRYFRLNPAHLFNFEAGRGCVFKCSFCYSPLHYGDNVRHKPPEIVVEELKKLVDLGAKHLFFVQDNFLNSPKWAVEVCKQIANADIPITFECYTTYPQLKEQIIDMLAEANCIGVFTGIDAVSISSQQRMNKPFLKSWEKTSEKLLHCLQKDIMPICAFILEEPDQDIEKIESVIYTALECIRLGCEVHINTLSIYNKTGLGKEFSDRDFNYSEIKPELMFDTPKIVQTNHFAKALPYLFPLHSTHNKPEEWETFIVKTYLISSLALGLTNTLYHFVVEEGRSIWKILDFIDSDYIKWIRVLKSSERRKSIILKFADYFTKENLSPETRNYFYRELAIVYLSNLKTKRIVNLLINGTKYEARIPWFINLDAFDDCLQANKTDNQTVAFLLNKKVQFYALPLQLWNLLKKVEKASNSGEILLLEEFEKNALLKNRWLSPIKTV